MTRVQSALDRLVADALVEPRLTRAGQTLYLLTPVRARRAGRRYRGRGLGVAGFASIAAAGQSIVRVLNQGFETDPPIDGRRTQAVLVRTNDFQESQVATVMGANALSVFLFRVDFNKAMRAAWSAAASVDGRAHLALDLHYLLHPLVGQCPARAPHPRAGHAMPGGDPGPVRRPAGPRRGLGGRRGPPTGHGRGAHRGPDADLRLAPHGLPALGPLPRPRPAPGRAGGAPGTAGTRRGAGSGPGADAMSNLFLPGRFDERVRRLALGIEPLDAASGGRLRHPIRILVETAAPGLPRPRLVAPPLGALRAAPGPRGPDVPVAPAVRLGRDPGPPGLPGRDGPPPSGAAPPEPDHTDRGPGRHAPHRAAGAPPSALPRRRLRRDRLHHRAARASGAGRGSRCAGRGWRRADRVPPRADPPVGRAHCDDRGEFLLLLTPAAAPMATLEHPFALDLVAYAPLAPGTAAAPVPARRRRALGPAGGASVPVRELPTRWRTAPSRRRAGDQGQPPCVPSSPMAGCSPAARP